MRHHHHGTHQRKPGPKGAPEPLRHVGTTQNPHIPDFTVEVDWVVLLAEVSSVRFDPHAVFRTATTSESPYPRQLPQAGAPEPLRQVGTTQDLHIPDFTVKVD